MTEVVKGGLRGRMGQYTVFVPASQIRMGYVKNLEDYKDKVLRLTLMPPRKRNTRKAKRLRKRPFPTSPQRSPDISLRPSV